MTIRWKSVRACVAGLASALVAGAAVQAQPEGRGGGRGPGGGGMMGGAFESALSSRDVERYAEFLALDDEQKAMVELLFEGYSTRTRQINEEARARMQEMRDQFREARDPSVWQGARESFEKIRADRDAAEKGFLSDVQALLGEAQAARWPDLERMMRRERTMARGRMSGERADVIRIVEEVKPPAEAQAQIGPLLAQYAIDLDRELIARNEVYDDVMSQVGELFRNGDAEAAQAAMEKARNASIRLRDLNRRYAREVSALLPEESRAAFDQAMLRASFPQVYRQSYTDRAISAVNGFADLDQTQRDQVAAIQANYRRDADALNSRLAEATEKAEEEFTIGQMLRRGGDGEGGVTGELRQQKRDLDRTTIENLRKVLRPEQLERLPERQEEDRGGFGRQRSRQQQGPPA